MGPLLTWRSGWHVTNSSLFLHFPHDPWYFVASPIRLVITIQPTADTYVHVLTLGCCVSQEDFLLCMQKRMEGILQEAEAIADVMAPGVTPAAIPGQPMSSLAAQQSFCQSPFGALPCGWPSPFQVV